MGPPGELASTSPPFPFAGWASKENEQLLLPTPTRGADGLAAPRYVPCAAAGGRQDGRRHRAAPAASRVSPRSILGQRQLPSVTSAGEATQARRWPRRYYTNYSRSGEEAAKDRRRSLCLICEIAAS